MKGKAVKCKLVCNSMSGYMPAPTEHPSIAAAVRAAKSGYWFAYRVFAGGKVVRREFCS